MLGISTALCPLMSVSSISSSPLALKDSWVIEKKNLLGSFFPYLAHSSFIHNYSRVIYSQDIRIPDLRWHRHFVGDTQVGQSSMVLPGARSSFSGSVSILCLSKILLHPAGKLLLQVLERVPEWITQQQQQHFQWPAPLPSFESSFQDVGQLPNTVLPHQHLIAGLRVTEVKASDRWLLNTRTVHSLRCH